MKPFATRLFLAVLIAALAGLTLGGAAPRGGSMQPDKLVILSTTDVKGEVKPCG